MGEFNITKIFCINYLECMKNVRKNDIFTLYQRFWAYSLS